MNIFSVYDAYTEKKTENYKVPFGDQSKCSFPTGDNVEGRPIIKNNSVRAAKVNKKPGPTVIALVVLFLSSVLIIYIFAQFLIYFCYLKFGKNYAKKKTSNELTPLEPNSSSSNK